MHRLIFVFLICFFSRGAAQPEINKWHFGTRCAVDFSAGIPQATPGSSMTSLEGCASIADAAGNLLFYTNGYEIWNSLNQPMANGSGLTGHESTTQSSLIIKKPGSGNEYYVFTLGNAGTGTLAYSVVDMSLASGMGSVTVKNQTLAINMTEKLAATKHCNGTDYWVMGHKWNSDEFQAFQLSAAGVSTTAVVSSVGFTHTGGANTQVTEYGGSLRFSPYGKKLCSVVLGYPQGPIEIFDFDPSSGAVTNAVQLGIEWVGYGCEFSGDGTKLYVTAYDGANQKFQLLQWNLCAGNDSAVAASRFVIDTVHVQLQALQNAPDGKMYVARRNTQNLGVINFPDSLGHACAYVDIGPSVGTATILGGLPNFVSNYFRQKPTFSQSVSCNTSSFHANVTGLCGQGYVVTGYQWQFGDPGSGALNTSSLASPAHKYPAAGDYTTTLIIQYDCGSDTIRQVVHIDLPQIAVAGGGTVCAGQAVILSASGAHTYTWSGGGNTASISVTPTASAVFTVSGSDTLSCVSSQTVSIDYSDCVGLPEKGEGFRFRVFPNPGEGIIKVNVSADCEATVLNQQGQALRRQFLKKGEQEWDLSDFAGGLYFVQWSKDGRSTGMTKLMIIH